jgi:hypothetical protein
VAKAKKYNRLVLAMRHIKIHAAFRPLLLYMTTK